MNQGQTLETIAAGRVIAILRGDFSGHEPAMVAAMIDGRITAVEITLNSPNAFSKITELVAQFGNRCAIGAGTVLNPDEVRRVVEVGGTFIVSPNTDPRVITATRQLGLASFPGAFTPTEIIAATDAGADAVKVFPATLLGPRYIKAVRAPLPQVRLVPTGGVTPELAREYAVAGAWAVGVGSELLGHDILADKSFAALRDRAAAFTQAMKLSP